MSDRPVVQLRTAFEFTCESCGKDTFIRAIVPESMDGLIPEGMELEDFEAGEWVMKPEIVECQHCGKEFEVQESD